MHAILISFLGYKPWYDVDHRRGRRPYGREGEVAARALAQLVVALVDHAHASRDMNTTNSYHVILVISHIRIDIMYVVNIYIYHVCCNAYICTYILCET